MEVIIPSVLHTAHDFNYSLPPVTIVQTWFYYVGYPADPWHTKSLVHSLAFSHVLCITHFKVLAVFISDTIHQALITHSGEHGHALLRCLGRN